MNQHLIINYYSVFKDEDEIDPNLDKEDLGFYDEPKNNYHNHDTGYLFRIKLSFMLCFGQVLLAIFQQVFGWFSLMRLKKNMMTCCLLNNALIVVVLFVYNHYRVDSNSMVACIAVLLATDSFLLVYMIFTVKTLTKEMEPKTSSAKREIVLDML